jgi:hypothetical protein
MGLAPWHPIDMSIHISYTILPILKLKLNI